MSLGAVPAGMGKAGGQPPATFLLHTSGPAEGRLLKRGDIYAAALAFLDGRINIEGDFLAALRELIGKPRSRLRQWFYAAAARLDALRPEALFQSRRSAQQDIQFHYDHDLEFYRQFLGERLVYSCAYFERPNMTLDQAQEAKLDHICRKLDVQPGERFLDIGCGFGALVAHAAGRYGAEAAGCTLSSRQHETAGRILRERGLQDHASVRLLDYRDLDGPFAKIASVGMYEHVGVHRLRGYFSKVYTLLAPDGLFLNHGIARPQTVKPGAESKFLRRKVFPGGELPHLCEAVRAAEEAGFEVLDIENLRPHYARTCREWVERLIAHEAPCLKLVGRALYRTWVLYLGVSALNFEAGLTDVHQILLAKRSNPQARRWTRGYIYA